MSALRAHLTSTPIKSLIFTQEKLFRDREHPQESVTTDEASRRTADLDSANLGGGGSGGIGLQLSTFAQQPDVRRSEEMYRPGGAYTYDVRNNLGFSNPLNRSVRKLHHT